MKEEYKSLVEELNKLSENFPATKDRMVEIAKILLAEHYGYWKHLHSNNKNNETN